MTTTQLIIACACVWLCVLTVCGAWTRNVAEQEKTKGMAIVIHNALVRAHLTPNAQAVTTGPHHSWCDAMDGKPCNCQRG